MTKEDALHHAKAHQYASQNLSELANEVTKPAELLTAAITIDSIADGYLALATELD